jgi:hypothetical protein
MTDLDLIDLSAIDPSPLGGNQAFIWLGQTTTSEPIPTGCLRGLDQGSTVIVRGNTDADPGIDFATELRNFAGALVSDDFVL